AAAGLRRQEGHGRQTRALLERKLRPDLSDPAPAGRRRADRRTPPRAARQARSPRVRHHTARARTPAGVAGRSRAAGKLPQRAPAQAVSRWPGVGGDEPRSDPRVRQAPGRLAPDLRGDRARPTSRARTTSRTAVLADDPPLRPAPGGRPP